MKTPWKTLWLVRHARPLIEADRCYGRLDIPADTQATAEAAHALHRALQPLADQVEVRHSPLQRCEQLAQSLQALRPDLASEADGRLVEMDFGTWEGRAWTDIAHADIEAWTARFADHCPGGGESLASMLRRVAHALQEARETAHRQKGDVLWISHAGVARCVQWLRCDQGKQGQYPTAAQWPVQAPAPGQWTCYAPI